MNTVDKLRRVLAESTRNTALSKNRAAGMVLAQAVDLNVGDLLEILAFALVECCAPEVAQDIARIRVEWEASARRPLHALPPQKPS